MIWTMWPLKICASCGHKRIRYCYDFKCISLEGKVAVVTGCDTGLGQGMALGLAQAGCDIVGINIVEPTETINQVTALGRRFLSLTADLRKIDGIPALLDRAVAEFGHIDILVNNAGLIRREDALEFSEKTGTMS